MAPSGSVELQAGFHVHVVLDSSSVGFFWSVGFFGFELWLCIFSLTVTLYKLVLSDFPHGTLATQGPEHEAHIWGWWVAP